MKLRRPAFVDLSIAFERLDQPAMDLPLDRIGDCTYARVVRLVSTGDRVAVSISPPLEGSVEPALEIERLSGAKLMRLGLCRAAIHLGKPKALYAKVRQYLSGSASFSVAATTSQVSSPAADYDRWRQAFEGPSERERLRAALRGSPRRRVLAVYATAAQRPDALADFLASPAGLEAGHILILADPGFPLAPSTLPLLQSRDFSVVEVAEGGLPLREIVEAGRRAGCVAFVFVESRGHFHELAMQAFEFQFDRCRACMAAYADSDELTDRGARVQPHFKPDWSPDYALAVDYVGPAVAFALDPELAAQVLRRTARLSYELLLRLEAAGFGARIAHIPRVLFHCRTDAASERDGIAAESSVCRDILETLERRDGTTGSVEIRDEGIRKIRWHVTAEPPLVSIVIPSRDHPHLLEEAIRAVQSADYPCKELIVVDNGSRDVRQQEMLDELRRRPDVKIVLDPRPFNFSALVNAGRRAAGGTVIVLLNDDVKAIDQSWLGELVSLAQRKEIGCVGALLLYPDGTIQHGGVVLGVRGVAGHAFRHMAPSPLLYGRRLGVTHEVAAVTGACLAVRASVFDELGGFDETLPVTLNDVDFCLRVRARGYRNLMSPDARLYHLESQSRMIDASPDALARLARETARFLQAWGDDALRDPYYSPHLSLADEDFRPRRL